MTDKPALASVAMTGEITLRGLILPIGGVKEKVLGAHRAGIKKVILPSRNRRDVLEVPDDVRDELGFVFAKTVDDVLAAAIPDLRVSGGSRKRAARASGKKRSRKATAPRMKRKRTKSVAKSTDRPVRRAARSARA